MMLMMEWISSRRLTSFIHNNNSVVSVLRLLNHANKCSYVLQNVDTDSFSSRRLRVSDPDWDKSDQSGLHTFEFEHNPIPIENIRWVTRHDETVWPQHQFTLTQHPSITPVFLHLPLRRPRMCRAMTILRRGDKPLHEGVSAKHTKAVHVCDLHTMGD